MTHPSLKLSIPQKIFLLISASLILAGLALMPQNAKAADSTCYDIYGSGLEVLVTETPNSGVMKMDYPYAPSTSYTACARDIGGNTLQLEGWVWNTNLGWVSLFCDNASDNQGIACGSYEYGVTVDKDDGELHGYAFGDNTGYISFNCEDDSGGCGANTHEVHAAVDIDCLGLIYSTTTYGTPTGCSATTSDDAFAWSDGLGWFDLSGIVIPFPPELYSVSPDNGDPAGGDSVTVEGANFMDTIYTTPIDITGTGTALTDYQIEVTLDTSTMISNSKMLSDCSDLRIYDTNGTSPLAYWIEDGTCNDTDTKVWVKVPSIAAAGTTTIYASYNGALGNSICEDVFLFCDDFSGSSLNLSKWEGDTGQFSVGSGILENTGNSDYRLSSIDTFSDPIILETKHITQTGGTPANGYMLGGFFASTSNSIGYMQHVTFDFYRNDSSWTAFGDVIPENIQMLVKYVASGTTVDLFINNYSTGASIHSAASVSNSIDSETIAVGRRYDNSDFTQAYDGDWDWVRVRQYQGTEPAVATDTETSSSIDVDIDASNCNGSLTIVDSGTITCTTPSGSGTVDVTVTNPDTLSIVQTDGFTYNAAPTVTLVTPDEGPIAGGTAVTITGTNFYEEYRRPITITNTGGSALTDYQVSFTLDTASLISAGKMQSDCGDLRVVDTDTTTNIPYWIVDGECNDSATTVWTKVPTIAAGPTTTTIYTTYGNSQLSTTSDGERVFEFFDDFEDASIDTNKWINYSASESGGYIYATTNNNGWRGIFGRLYFGDDLILMHKITYAGDVGVQGSGVHGMWREWAPGQSTTFDETGGFICGSQTDNSSTSQTCSGSLSLSDVWDLARLIWDKGTDTEFYAIENGSSTFTTTISANDPTDSLKVQYGAYDNNAGFGAVEMWVYWSAIRKFSATEPTFPSTSVGSETTTTAIDVDFDTTDCTSIVIVSPTSITCTTPAHADGLVDVTVTTPAGSGVCNSCFEYFALPTVTNVNPDKGPYGGSTFVTITGTNFYDTSTVTFDVGGTPASCTGVIVVNDTTITCTTSAHVADTVDVSVTTPTGTGTLTNGFTYYGPPDAGNSTVVANPSTVAANGTAYTKITVTVLDAASNPVPNRDITIAQDGSADVDQIDCTTESEIAVTQTDANGQVCYKGRDIVVETVNFEATDTGTAIVLGSDSASFTCDVLPNQQCVTITIYEDFPDTGAISMTAADNFTFLPITTSISEQDLFTCDEATDCPSNVTGYDHDVDDIIEIYDTRDDGGFTVQIQASTAFENAGQTEYLPLDNFYVVSTAAETGGTQSGGVEYTPLPATLCTGAPLDTAGDLLTAGTFTAVNATFGTGQTPSTIQDVMQCVLGVGGRIGYFKQNLNYYLKVPALQTADNYEIILTYDLTI